MSITNLSDHPRFDAGRPDHAWYAGDPRRTVRVDCRTVVVEDHVIREIPAGRGHASRGGRTWSRNDSARRV